MATDKEEQAELLFFGTSVALTECNLTDVRSETLPHRDTFPLIPTHEVETIISGLPTKKASGPDKVQNELLKLAKSQLSPILANLFNFCLRSSFYPPKWKT